MLTPGQKLGPYEIDSPLGAGGMGEVYRARDTRLERTVAIKVLPSHLSSNPDLKKRFEREAKAISSLNHPHICQLYDVGSQDGVDFLVMEYLEGETLAKRLEKGALPLEQVLKIGADLAEALDKAHRAGIIHRDLKPGNVMLTKSGAKLMDFGLAKSAPGEFAGGAASAPLLSAAVTMTSPSPRQSPLTSAGAVVGTIQYMSPEQIEGKEADARSDIFALGAMLYEMATGRRAFKGKSQLSVASAILEKDPEPLGATLPAAPPAFDLVIRTCVAKDPDERFQTAHDLMLQLRWLGESPSSMGTPAAGRTIQPTWQRVLPWAIAAALVIVAGVALWSPWRAAPAAPAVVHFTIPPVPGQEFVMNSGGLAISPNGAYVVYSSATSKTREARQLYLRPLDRNEAVLIRGSEGAASPFFSPDGQWIAFTAQGKQQKAPLAGGTPIILCDKPYGAGGTWAPDGTIFFTDRNSKLLSVAGTGGKPQEVATVAPKPGESGLRWPQALPGGQAILYVLGGTSSTSSDDASIGVVSLKTGQHKTLIQGGTSPRYVSSGHLIFAQGGRLMAVPFDLPRLEVTGPAAPVFEDVWQGGGGYSGYDISENGVLVSVSGGEHYAAHALKLTWVDRKGVASPIEVPANAFGDPKISPDGKLVALTIRGTDPQSEVHVFDLVRGTLTRITFSKTGESARGPIWTPDGKRLIYRSGDGTKLSWKLADGSGPEELLYSTDVGVRPSAILSDGRLLFEHGNLPGVSDLWLLNLAGDRKAGPLLEDKFMKVETQVSPDGRWLAYYVPRDLAGSGSLGSGEIFVQPLPGLGGKWQVSTAGGAAPRWSRDGRQLIYCAAGGKVMAVDVEAKTTFTAGIPRLLFQGTYTRARGSFDYDIATDGQHFLMLKEEDASTAPLELRVVLNWTEELKSRLGTIRK